jgi:hypothetical protein
MKDYGRERDDSEREGTVSLNYGSLAGRAPRRVP